MLILADISNGIQRLMNGYWWGEVVEIEKGIRWMKRETLCTSKEEGGLGFRELRQFNNASTTRMETCE